MNILEMKKKVVFGGVALSAFTLAVVSPVFAASEVSNATSDATVTLTANEDEDRPSIIDPEDNGDGETGNKGSLTIDYASHLSFDTHALSSKARSYKTVTEQPHVQITDARGTGAGWSLQVAATEFKDEETGKELQGATLTLPAGTTQTTTDNTSATPTTNGVVLSETAKPIMTASADQGMGTWATVFEQGDVELYVPSGNYAGDYQATLTWNLVDAPQ